MLSHCPPAPPSSHLCAAASTFMLLFSSTFVVVEGIPTGWLGQAPLMWPSAQPGGVEGWGHHMQREGGMLGANTASDKWPQEARGPPERSLAWLLLPCSTDSDQAFAWPGSQPQEPISLYGGGAHTQLSVLSSQEPPPPGSPRCRAAPLPASTLLLTRQRLRGLPLLWLCAAGAVLGPLPNRRGGGVH